MASDFREEHNLPLLLVTLDSEGAIAVNQFGLRSVPSFEVSVVDSTGAGDAFNAGVIAGLIRLLSHPDNTGRDPLTILETISLPQMENIIRGANAVGALACTKLGAWSALPTRGEWETFLAQQA